MSHTQSLVQSLPERLDLRSLAVVRSFETKHSEFEWLGALENAYQSLRLREVDCWSLKQIALSSRSPRKFTGLVRLIYQCFKLNPKGERIFGELLETVDDSVFSLADWIDAINYFCEWLHNEGRSTDLFSMIEYLKCCASASGAATRGQNLYDLVRLMLSAYGYHGSG